MLWSGVRTGQHIVRLSTFLKRKNLTCEAWGETIGRSKASVSRYARLEIVPDPATQLRMYVASGGAVKPNDHFRLPRLTAEQKGAAP